MKKDFDDRPTPGLKRREFLAVGTLPLVAALGPANLVGRREADASRSPQQPIRVGLIGAGANARAVHIPGFQRIPECQITAVANRSMESSRRVADEFNIPRAYADWRDLLDDDSIDAVCIGTWPYMHRTLTVAALESGKHVLCQARMANTAQEARDMLDASLRHPELISQLVPTSQTYRIDNALKRMINDGFLGEILSVELQRLQTRFPTVDGDLDWRHDVAFSGYNTLNIGASYEAMMRWLGRSNRVMAMSKVHVPYRRNGSGDLTSVGVADHVDILFELAGGAQVHMRASETTGLSTGNHTWIYGSEGTIHVDRRQNVFAGRRGDSELAQVPNPREAQAYYRVEEEFINAIRGIERITMAPFETGVHYMEWTEAVYRSSQTGQAEYLPL
ncbi:MAG TPA: Gfo/Idh/MocA family oxidoreductase [Gemmatimonadetes bacterium]|nr:Gfo/Idh/MocA family oxidoreductase [Gemmatimonadota bacterium]HIN50266.1 Gfo/Idh/MocA family oxidoreductase [Gemmatimonadota bacterium]